MACLVEGVKDLHGKHLQQQPSKRKQQRQGSMGKPAGQVQGEQQQLQKGSGRRQQQQKGKHNEQQQQKWVQDEQQQPLAQMGPAGLRLCSTASAPALCSTASAPAPLPLPVENHQYGGAQEQVMPCTGFDLLAPQTQYEVHQQPQEPREQLLPRAPQDQQGAGDLHHDLQQEQQQQCREGQHRAGQQQPLLTAQPVFGLQQHHVQQQRQEAHVPQTVAQHCWALPFTQQQEEVVGKGEQWGQGMLQQVLQQQQWQQLEVQQQPQCRKPQLWTEQLKQFQEFQEAQQSKEEQHANQQQQQLQQGGLLGVVPQSYRSLLQGSEDRVQQQILSEPQLQRQQVSMAGQDGVGYACALDPLAVVGVHSQLLPHSQPFPAASGATAPDLDHFTLPASPPGLQLPELDMLAPDLDDGLDFDDLLADIVLLGSGYQELQGGLDEQGEGMQQHQQQQQHEGQIVAYPVHACNSQNQGQPQQQLSQQAGWC